MKIIWNFLKAWNGDGARSTWSYTYWDRGEQLPLYYEGTAKVIGLTNRVEPEYLTENDGDVFPNEKRNSAFGIEVDAPFDARGILVLTYRYKTADGPLKQAKNDDTWVYVPDLRRVRRISSAQRTDSVQGTDFTMDDLRSFAGIPPQYEWKCLGEATVIAPMNTKSLAYPYTDTYNFGPYGFSYASDRWEVRNAWIVRFDPRNEDHPYHHKDIYIDKETFEPLYSFAYDRKKELWKIIWHNHRYTSDWDGKVNKDPEGGRRHLVPGLGRRARPEGQPDRVRHHRERADGHGQPDRVLEQRGLAVQQQGQDPPLHRHRAAEQGPLILSDTESLTRTARRWETTGGLVHFWPLVRWVGFNLRFRRR